MIGSSAVAGWISLSGVPTAKQYSLDGFTSNSCPPDQGNLNIVPESLSIVNQASKLYLIFQLNIITPESKLVLAVGPTGLLPGSNYLLTQHRTMTSVLVNYATGEIKENFDFPLNPHGKYLKKKLFHFRAGKLFRICSFDANVAERELVLLYKSKHKFVHHPFRYIISQVQ